MTFKLIVKKQVEISRVTREKSSPSIKLTRVKGQFGPFPELRKLDGWSGRGPSKGEAGQTIKSASLKVFCAVGCFLPMMANCWGASVGLCFVFLRGLEQVRLKIKRTVKKLLVFSSEKWKWTVLSRKREMQKCLRASPEEMIGLADLSATVNGRESSREGVSKWDINYSKYEPSLLWMLYLESLLLIISSNVPLPFAIWIIINIDTVLQLIQEQTMLFCSPAALK